MDEKWELGNEGLIYTYAQIAFHLAFRYLKLIEEERVEPEALGFPRVVTWVKEIDNEIEGLKIQSIIITAFFLEAYINDYSIRYLEKSIAKRLDRLDTPSKFLIITKLVWNDQLNKGSHSFEKLQQLFKLRNQLAHPKPSNRGNLLDAPKILQDQKLIKPDDCIDLILETLLFFSKSHQDEVTDVLLKQIYAWLNVAKIDLDFYPVRNNAGL